jgi:putative oxidoreductase
MGFFTGLHHLSDWALVALRLGVGASFLAHGIQKSAMWKMQPSAQLPAGMLSILRFLSIVEPLGAVGVLVGFLTQPAAAGLAIIMLGAIRLKAVQMHRGFTGDGGWELDFMLLAAAVALFISGAGRLSLDRVLLRM